MASSRRSQHELIKLVMTFIFILCLTLTSSKSDDDERSSNKEKSQKLVLGSKPPTCVNKCLSCKPCIATLVVHTHHQVKSIFFSKNNYEFITSNNLNDYGDNNHDSYYLMSWKCKCGNKLFQP
ncbi:hypothetical protein RND81_11G128100 [Saponaria officinalis]|uniref:Epidermal patterning factor-like protein n=1 Tax=Saponaria officinalis TaxID=3572 RepID=A0AAW1HLU5_SAPOF